MEPVVEVGLLLLDPQALTLDVEALTLQAQSLAGETQLRQLVLEVGVDVPEALAEPLGVRGPTRGARGPRSSLGDVGCLLLTLLGDVEGLAPDPELLALQPEILARQPQQLVGEVVLLGQGGCLPSQRPALDPEAPLGVGEGLLRLGVGEALLLLEQSQVPAHEGLLLELVHQPGGDANPRVL